MRDECIILLLFFVTITIGIVLAVGIRSQLEYVQDKMIAEMVSKGINPIDAACSIRVEDCTQRHLDK